MGILLLLVGLLTAASGGAKLRGRARSAVGYSPVAVVETVVGVAVSLSSGLGLARFRPAAWAVVTFAILLTLVSTWYQARRVSEAVKRRRLSEEWRLRVHMMKEEGGEVTRSNDELPRSNRELPRSNKEWPMYKYLIIGHSLLTIDHSVDH